MKIHEKPVPMIKMWRSTLSREIMRRQMTAATKKKAFVEINREESVHDTFCYKVFLFVKNMKIF